MSNGGFVIMPTDPKLEDDQVILAHTVFEEQKVLFKDSTEESSQEKVQPLWNRLDLPDFCEKVVDQQRVADLIRNAALKFRLLTKVK